MSAALRLTWALGALAMLAGSSGCSPPPVESVQRGYRGLGMEQLYNPRQIAASVVANKAPTPPGPPINEGAPASSVYKNLQVLGDVNIGEFTRLMIAMSQWVAPDQGCAYCHDVANMGSDALYTKVVARRMLQMTQQINSQWKSHLANTGVTCYTCHRGQAVPAYIWFRDDGPKQAMFAGNRAGQNWPAPMVGLTSLPFDPFTPFLLQANEIRVVSTTALPSGDRKSIKQTEWTYALMMHISQALGVNCTFCHNTRSFAEWDASTPQRGVAWYGIRMVRELNNNYLVPLAGTLPANRHGPLGDGPKIDCATCHQGAYKPLYGAPMAVDFPELGLRAPAAAVAAQPGAGAAEVSSDTALTDLVARIYFETGKAAIAGEAAKAVDDAARRINEHAGLMVDVSGFADKTGNAEQNLELAKARAVAVRDALAKAGVDAARINLKKPEFVIGGAEAEARRVDVVAAK
jgi:photosynthetic reaction center cytochrome c subunit